ncbi:MAG TPA: methyltransferase [Myxococcota bacterium]|nr:methyltransferase [Myxococcota bacterium]HRY96147.1 methyltransferase [Myxococcota bacterium]HSA22447.1 methyltransferase [Myxococcota bacterium]
MPDELEPLADETLDRICGVLQVLQARRGYRFGLEALLLPAFARPGARSAVDLGTGSGVMALLLARFGGAARVTGVELQPRLAARARRSVALNQLGQRVEIVEADLRALPRAVPAGAHDLVLSNPPYGKQGEGQACRTSERALARQELGCRLGDVVAAARRLLAFRGRFAVVLPPARLPELLGLCQEHGLRPARLRLVHGRIELPACHALVECVRGGRTALTVEPPLVVYARPEVYTAEVEAMLYPAGRPGE